MRFRQVLLVSVLTAVCLAAHPARPDTTIVVNFGSNPSAKVAGGAEAEVNWLDADPADDTICTECFAAVELQHYLRKMAGRGEDFAIVDDDQPNAGDLILLGGPESNAATREFAGKLGVDAEQLSEVGAQGYRIRSAETGGRRITLIAGGGREGTLYGAYDLLYRLGCRWFAPGELHEEVPQIEGIVDFDLTERPSFHTRGFMAWQDRGNPEFLLWMARNRLNDWCIEQSDHPLVRKLGIKMVCGMHDAEWLFLRPSSAYPYDHPQFDNDDDRPKNPYPPGSQYQGDVDSDGKLSYFEAHPEWFAFEGGRRIPGIGDWSGTNFCTSNPSAVTEFMRNYVQALIDGPYRGADIIRFWTLDAGRWCQCEACKALGTPSDRNLLLVERLDREIKQARAAGRIHRSIPIRFLVYADVLSPPTRPLPPGFDYATCSGTFYPIARCYVHDFDDPDCPRNVRYQQQLHGWVADPERHYRGQLVIGEYYNVSGYQCLPVVFMNTMTNDIPHYYKVGARYFQYMHVTTANWGNKALTNYQMARQLWDVNTDCEALLADYFTRRYGPAACTMRRFYESLEKMLSNVTELKYGLARRLNRGAEDLFPERHLQYRRQQGIVCDGRTLVEIVADAKKCRELIDEALTAELPDRIRGRIAEDERMFTYGEQTILFYDECVQTLQLARANKLDEARTHYRRVKQLADSLRADTTSPKFTYEPCLADALQASYAPAAVAQLAELLGP
ncbi:MAG: DUF4838 domain-containing protein [Planctomycetes bacterium]|nr:DUF4838 domain-containing protein [Planctomycetota bacterium]MBL7037478.1 DUF4838 domain-containing protein [Pirellulaceae bacterium]